MDIYKVLQKFRDIETKEVYEANREIELSEERASEVIANLSNHEGEFLERIVRVVEYEKLSHEELEKVNNDDLKSRLDELVIEYNSKATKQELIALLKGDVDGGANEGKTGDQEEGK